MLLPLRALHVPIIAFDFALNSPHGLMISDNLFCPMLRIVAGVLAFLNRTAVTLFTLISVHCAESITAINASKGVFQSRVGCGSGYSFSNISAIFMAELV